MLDKQKKASLGCRKANCRSVLSARQCFLSKYLLTASGAGTAAGLAGPYSMHLCFVGVRMKEGSAFFSPPYTMRGKGIPDHTPRCCQQEQTQAEQQLSHLSAHLPEETSALLKEIKHLLFILYTSATGKGPPFLGPIPHQPGRSKTYFLPGQAETNNVSLSIWILGGEIHYIQEKRSPLTQPPFPIHPNAAYALSWQKVHTNTSRRYRNWGFLFVLFSHWPFNFTGSCFWFALTKCKANEALFLPQPSQLRGCSSIRRQPQRTFCCSCSNSAYNQSNAWFTRVFYFQIVF